MIAPTPSSTSLSAPLPLPSAQKPLLTHAIWAAGGLVLLALLVLPFDLQLSTALRGDWIGGDLRRIILLAEVYGHGSGVAMILISMAVLDPTTRRRLLRVALCAFGAGMAANVIKICVARVRPHGLPADATVADSYAGLMPLLLGTTQAYGHALQSFPSAHTATAVGLALAMTRLYPHGRWLFACLAALATLQRVIVGAHFPSDCLCGAAVGLVVGALLIDSRRGTRWLDRFESRATATQSLPELKQAA